AVNGGVKGSLERFLGQGSPRAVGRELEAAPQAFEDRHAVLRGPARLLPWKDAPLIQRKVRVAEHEVGIGLELGPEARAGRTRPVRGVEGEGARLDLADGEVALGTREPLREETLGALS